jgi:hypothetical protein
MFSGAWVLIILGAVTIPISAILAYPMMVFSQSPTWFRRWFLFGATFQNTVALPLVLIQTICTQVTFAKVDLTNGMPVRDTNNSIIYLNSFECIVRVGFCYFLFVLN